MRHFSLHARILDGPAALVAIATHWQRLYAADPAATPFQSPAWIGCWADRLQEPDRPCVLLAHDRDQQPAAALALGQHYTPGGIEFRPLGAPRGEIVRPVGPLADDSRALAQIVRALESLTRGRSVHLGDLPTESGLARYLAGRAGWRSCSKQSYASVPLPLDYSAMSRSTRRTHERRQRAWNDIADVRYHRTRTTADLIRAVDVLDSLHQRRHGGGIDPRLRPVIASLGAQGATIATLAVGPRYIAAQLLLTRGGRAWSLSTGMEDADPWRALAPGHALIRYLAADLAEHGYTRLDLGRTKPRPGQLAYKGQYKPEWSHTITQNRASQRFSPPATPAVPAEMGTVA